MTDFTKENTPAGEPKQELTPKIPGTRDEPIPPPEERRRDGTQDKMPNVLPSSTDQYRTRVKRITT